MSDSKHYDVFLRGEVVDLVVPNERAIHVDRWYDWFNNQETARYLEQGFTTIGPPLDSRSGRSAKPEGIDRHREIRLAFGLSDLRKADYMVLPLWLDHQRKPLRGRAQRIAKVLLQRRRVRIKALLQVPS